VKSWYAPPSPGSRQAAAAEARNRSAGALRPAAATWGTAMARRSRDDGAPRDECALLVHLLGGRLVLIEDPHLDVARRLVAEILLAVDGAARNIIVVAGLEHLRRLPLDGERNFAFLDRGPLLAGWRWNWLPAPGGMVTDCSPTSRVGSFSNGIVK
jgi:hypothetical protein